MGLREEYQKKIEAQITEWEARIKELKAKAEQAKADVKIEYIQQIDALKLKRDLIKKNMEDLKSSGEEAWEPLKTKIDTAMDEFKGMLDGIMSKFK